MNDHQIAQITLESTPQVDQKPTITLDQLVTIAIEQDASDIHFTEGGRVALRVHGKFVFVEGVNELSSLEVQRMMDAMLSDETEKKRLRTLREVDFSFLHSTGVSFRVNAFYTQNKLSAVMRMISKHLPEMNELGIPQVMRQLLSFSEGLILVTGPAASGKSTSIQAMLEYVNKNEAKHIITIENPIEHIFKGDKSIISQRELGKDTLSFANAMHSASREDPDIVMVADIPDKETFDALLKLAEMGHLVVASLSTKNALHTLEHIMALYPYKERAVMQDRLAENLLAIMSQDLVDRIDQQGRIGIFEMLVATKGIKGIVQRGSLTQLRSAIESEAAYGSITMDAYANQLAKRGYISWEDAKKYRQMID